jgi:hypothetical protein
MDIVCAVTIKVRKTSMVTIHNLRLTVGVPSAVIALEVQAMHLHGLLVACMYIMYMYIIHSYR